MSDCIIAMKTHTDAERARRAALIEQIAVETVHIDPAITKRGCSVGIKFPCEYSEHLIHLLEKKKISYGALIGKGN